MKNIFTFKSKYKYFNLQHEKKKSVTKTQLKLTLAYYIRIIK